MDAESKHLASLHADLEELTAQVNEQAEEIVKLKAEIEELLTRHARRENVYLNCLDAAVQELEWLKKKNGK